MTKKDYEIIAGAVRTITPAATRSEVARVLAGVCQRDNERFKRETFLRACGVEPLHECGRDCEGWEEGALNCKEARKNPTRTSDGRTCTCGGRKRNGLNLHRAGCAYYAELPEGVTLMSFAAGPGAIHSAIKEAVGE